MLWFFSMINGMLISDGDEKMLGLCLQASQRALLFLLFLLFPTFLWCSYFSLLFPENALLSLLFCKKMENNKKMNKKC